MTTIPSPSSFQNSLFSGKPPLLCFLVGSTASGKNSLAPAVAGDLGAEILSMDSMKIYRGMDIGTAKLSVSKRMGIPYHLIDIIDPLQSFSVREYVEHAVEAVKDIVSRGKKPLFVGLESPPPSPSMPMIACERRC